MSSDYYELLGVARDATATDIKKAFRQIARECHPDVSGGDADAEERFKKARVAYETLMDPVTRARYDRRGQRRAQAPGPGGSFFDAFYKATSRPPDGAARPPGGPPPQGQGTNPMPGGRVNVRAKKDDPRNNIGLDDLFNVGEFGFGSTHRAGTAAPPPGAPPSAGGDVEIDLDVPAEVAARGGSVTAVYFRMQRSDSWRPGTGETGLVRVQDIADIRIVPGTREGTLLRERGLGDAGAFGGGYGDLIARVRLVGPTASSSRPPPPEPAEAPRAGPSWAAGTTPDEVVTLDIGVVEALLGGRVSLDTPQGRVRLTVPPGTSSGTRMRLKGKGSAQPTGELGDLFAEVRILVPKVLDEESRRLIEEFAKLNP
jgi:DnaJ-class molecular chaperone